ncbi:hypothetical protein GQ53DRAFT_435575 [Thozetella sp. PMI_491]|nr:hypothetical protein GQ53DRAFT_435575 [Thozetella sp. PMI_491]
MQSMPTPSNSPNDLSVIAQDAHKDWAFEHPRLAGESQNCRGMSQRKKGLLPLPWACGCEGWLPLTAAGSTRPTLFLRPSCCNTQRAARNRQAGGGEGPRAGPRGRTGPEASNRALVGEKTVLDERVSQVSPVAGVDAWEDPLMASALAATTCGFGRLGGEMRTVVYWTGRLCMSTFGLLAVSTEEFCRAQQPAGAEVKSRLVPAGINATTSRVGTTLPFAVPSGEGSVAAGTVRATASPITDQLPGRLYSVLQTQLVSAVAAQWEDRVLQNPRVVQTRDDPETASRGCYFCIHALMQPPAGWSPVQTDQVPLRTPVCTTPSEATPFNQPAPRFYQQHPVVSKRRHAVGQTGPQQVPQRRRGALYTGTIAGRKIGCPVSARSQLAQDQPFWPP